MQELVRAVREANVNIFNIEGFDPQKEIAIIKKKSLLGFQTKQHSQHCITQH